MKEIEWQELILTVTEWKNLELITS